MIRNREIIIGRITLKALDGTLILANDKKWSIAVSNDIS
jgi:hypothetical protein